MTKVVLNDIVQATDGRVAVLLGGNSAEREVSLRSGAAVADALAAQGLAVTKIDTAGDGWMSELAAFSHCFLALHGPGGEDGTVQGALECLGVRYTGSGVMASALAMDKLRCKLLWLGCGLSTPKFVELDERSNWAAIANELGEAIVKPACEGSSIGMSKACNASELEQAWLAAKPYGRVFAEQWVSGGEYTVAILDGEALPAIRLETDAAFYDFNAKYLSDSTRYHCPAGLNDHDEAELRDLALKAFNAVGCRGWGRVDVMRGADGRFYLLEVNTVPGMTDHSLVPMAAKQAGMNFEQLVLRVLHSSLAGEAGANGR